MRVASLAALFSAGHQTNPMYSLYPHKHGKKRKKEGVRLTGYGWTIRNIEGDEPVPDMY
jgi:hypothetical protein